MTLDEFLDWEARQPLRYEFIAGRPVRLPDSTQGRSLLITDIVSLLKPVLKGTGMRVLVNIRVPLPKIEECRYPAVVVDAGPYVPTALEPSQPALIIDVDRERDWSASTWRSISIDQLRGRSASSVDITWDENKLGTYSAYVV